MHRHSSAMAQARCSPITHSGLMPSTRIACRPGTRAASPRAGARDAHSADTDTLGASSACRVSQSPCTTTTMIRRGASSPSGPSLGDAADLEEEADDGHHGDGRRGIPAGLEFPPPGRPPGGDDAGLLAEEDGGVPGPAGEPARGDGRPVGAMAVGGEAGRLGYVRADATLRPVDAGLEPAAVARPAPVPVVGVPAPRPGPSEAGRTWGLTWGRA